MQRLRALASWMTTGAVTLALALAIVVSGQLTKPPTHVTSEVATTTTTLHPAVVHLKHESVVTTTSIPVSGPSLPRHVHRVRPTTHSSVLETTIPTTTTTTSTSSTPSTTTTTTSTTTTTTLPPTTTTTHPHHGDDGGGSGGGSDDPPGDH